MSHVGICRMAHARSGFCNTIVNDLLRFCIVRVISVNGPPQRRHSTNGSGRSKQPTGPTGGGQFDLHPTSTDLHLHQSPRPSRPSLRWRHRIRMSPKTEDSLGAIRRQARRCVLPRVMQFATLADVVLWRPLYPMVNTRTSSVCLPRYSRE